MDTRQQSLHHWLQQLGYADYTLAPASSDASFRRYWRLRQQNDTWIVMDAPPDKQDCGPFIDIAKRLLVTGIQVPAIQQQNLDDGFLLLTDLGDDLYLNKLNVDTVDRCYRDAIATLLRFQQHADCRDLPPYDHKLLHTELEIFRTWLLGKELKLNLSAAQNRLLDHAYALLVASALAQPRVFVHRDYHSRNLLVTGTNNPGVLDFQDAVIGPFTYDLVSLLRDCYIVWPEQQVYQWALEYLAGAQAAGLASRIDAHTFLRWFDLMGMQRHLKAAGIFARLWHRDGKSGYLGDIPRTLNYIVEVSRRYPEFGELHGFVAETVVPAFARLHP